MSCYPFILIKRPKDDSITTPNLIHYEIFQPISSY